MTAESLLAKVRLRLKPFLQAKIRQKGRLTRGLMALAVALTLLYLFLYSLEQRLRHKALFALEVASYLLMISGLALFLQTTIIHQRQDVMAEELIANFQKGVTELAYEPEKYQSLVDRLTPDLSASDLAVERNTKSEPQESTPAGTPRTTPSEDRPSAETKPIETMPTATAPAEATPQETVTAETTATKPVPPPVKIDVLATISIPKINLAMPVSVGATEASLKVAIGHYTPSVLPGEIGQSILFGHRMYTYGRHFNRLNELAKNDEVVMDTATKHLVYEVTEVTIVLPEELDAIVARPFAEPYLTLITCDPVRVASHRLIVTCRLKRADNLQT